MAFIGKFDIPRISLLENIGKVDYYRYRYRNKGEVKMYNIGNKLKKFRKRKSMSQKEFSEFLGISQNYLSEIETGRHVPSLKQISNMAIKMNTTIAKLLGEKSA
jgi:DNA-binding XRE family transcriptional regulator